MSSFWRNCAYIAYTLSTLRHRFKIYCKKKKKTKGHTPGVCTVFQLNGFVPFVLKLKICWTSRTFSGIFYLFHNVNKLVSRVQVSIWQKYQHLVTERPTRESNDRIKIDWNWNPYSFTNQLKPSFIRLFESPFPLRIIDRLLFFRWRFNILAIVTEKTVLYVQSHNALFTYSRFPGFFLSFQDTAQ